MVLDSESGTRRPLAPDEVRRLLARSKRCGDPPEPSEGDAISTRVAQRSAALGRRSPAGGDNGMAAIHVGRVSNPWELVLDSIERHEDGLALMSLAEYRSEELAANGLSIAHMANPSAWTERGLAEAIADHMNRCFATADWSYRDFYGATRSLDASPDNVRRFIERCRSRGVAFGYLD